MQADAVKDQRPSYVMFERRPVEDRALTLKNGRYTTVDADFAVVTPIGSKDRIPRKVDEWFAYLDQQAQEERIPRSWVHQYRQAYDAWKSGQEVPLNGTPIKGWAMISPAAQQNIMGANILTVEDLASANDEARRRIGMGAGDLIEKAKAWLKSATDTGAIAAENANLRSQLAAALAQVEALREVNEDLRNQVEILSRAATGAETAE